MSQPVAAMSLPRLSAIGTSAVASMVELIGLSTEPSTSGAMNVKPKGEPLPLDALSRFTFPPNA
jgi:hypothetical protein